MANEYAVNSADLQVVADAIRAKAGLSSGLTFPMGFAEAIEAITTGGGGAAASGLAYDMGEWSVDADKTSINVITIPHNLGDVPEFVCVWSDQWAGATEAPYTSGTTYVGWIWMQGITGTTGRASSAANVTNPFMCNMTISANDYRMGGGIPSSAAYGIVSGRLPTNESIFTPTLGAGTLWRAGVTYKYFVSKAWWNVGGGSNA